MFQSDVISALLVLGAFLVLHLFFYLFGIFQKHNKLPEPMVSSAQRGPGQSLLKKIDAVNMKLQSMLVFMFLLPVLIFVAHLSYSSFWQVPESSMRIAISSGGGLLILGYYMIKFFRIRSNRRKLQIGYDGEVAVARELNQMDALGYQVYHDFPGDGFNIDHILIGPAGIMAVETKTLSPKKGPSHRKITNKVVTYDGRMLHFPKHSDHQSIDKAKRQAAWLSQWLSSAIGEDVCARAMVALPGWFVKRTSADGIPVVNPDQFETLFRHIKPRPIRENLIGQIVREVEQHCSQSDPRGNSCYTFSQ